MVLLGATLRFDGAGGVPGLGTLRGTGSTLTSYVYQNSPTGEGNQPTKAYAAAFVLLVIVLALNAAVDGRPPLRRKAMERLTPRPVRRLSLDAAATGRARRPGPVRGPASPARAPAGSRRAHAVEELSIAYGGSPP